VYLGGSRWKLLAVLTAVAEVFNNHFLYMAAIFGFLLHRAISHDNEHLIQLKCFSSNLIFLTQEILVTSIIRLVKYPIYDLPQKRSQENYVIRQPLKTHLMFHLHPVYIYKMFCNGFLLYRAISVIINI